jgi:hypothetical protein
MATKRRLKLDLDLAAAANLVFDSYLDFLTAPVPPEERSDSKAFAARHTAGRTALAHLGDIEKRAESIGDETQQQAIGAILAEARLQLAGAPPDEKEAADGDPGGNA